MIRDRGTLLTAAALALGLALLAIAMARADVRSLGALAWQLGAALPLALLPSAAWHIVRTLAWRRCFPADAQPPFARLARVRLAAEAFSFVTIRGVGGEPLKVVLLQRDLSPTVSAAAVVLERVAYLLVTAAIVGLAAVGAMLILPLTYRWVRLFAIVALLAIIVLAATLVLLLRGRTAPASSPDPPSALRRFLRAFDAQARALVYGDRRRLVTLILLETSAYILMAIEVWVVLWAARTPISAIGAMAVETFTRVASMVSAFIPANLGALEASNVAAAIEMHAAGGAVALALVRRLRGLIWCAGGFLIYPRRGTGAKAPAPPLGTEQPSTPEPHRTDDVLVVLENDRASQVTLDDRLGGLTIGERILRAAVRAGYRRVLVWTPQQRATWTALAQRTDLAVDVIAFDDATRWRSTLALFDPNLSFTVLAPAVVASPSLLAAARAVMVADGQPIADVPASPDVSASGVFRSAPASLLDGGRAMVARLDAHRQPSGDAAPSLRVGTRDELREAERRLRASVVKPTDANLARFNRRLSIPISVALIRWMRFSPHAMSLLLLVLGLSAGWLFSYGNYTSGVAAALLSLAASILDGCDGELARLQYRESAFGCWLDTLGDYTYYIAIFTGLTIGTVRHEAWPGYAWVGGALLAGMLLAFALLILLRRRITRGRPERLLATTRAHFMGTGKAWARMAARLSNCATRATMPYGIVAFAVVGLLPWLLVLAAVGAQAYWITLALELGRLLDGAGSSIVQPVAERG